jgi:aspartate racemase
MATTGTVTAEQRSVFHTAARRLIGDQGAKAIMLGGTDLVLAFDARDSEFPLIDCAKIHVEAIADRGMNRRSTG